MKKWSNGSTRALAASPPAQVAHIGQISCLITGLPDMATEDTSHSCPSLLGHDVCSDIAPPKDTTASATKPYSGFVTDECVLPWQQGLTLHWATSPSTWGEGFWRRISSVRQEPWIWQRMDSSASIFS